MNKTAEANAPWVDSCGTLLQLRTRRSISREHQAYLRSLARFQFGIRGEQIKDTFFQHQPSRAQEIARGQSVAYPNLGRVLARRVGQYREKFHIDRIRSNENSVAGRAHPNQIIAGRRSRGYECFAQAGEADFHKLHLPASATVIVD